MAGQHAPMGAFNLDELGDDEGANGDFMRYIESLDIPVDEDNDLDEVVADLMGDDMSSESAHVEASASGSERPSHRRSRSSSLPMVSLESRNADDDKLSKMREKNRQAQARFRKRQKQERDDLEARINNASVRIDAAKDHRSSLASTNQQLVRRAGDAAAALLDVRRASQAADQATTPPTATPSAVVGAAGASPNITSASTTVSVYMPVPRPRPVDAFAHHVPLSLDAVLAHAPQDPYASPHGSFGDGAQSPDNLPGMVAAYKSDVAATVRRPIADICWFIQTPYQAAPAAMLSFTTTMSSLECCASFLVFYFATTLEGAFMAQECALADGSATPESSADFGCGNMPDDALLARLEALCASSGGGNAEQRAMRASVNVHEACLLHVAVPHILTRLLHQYHTSLPYRHWLLVCVNFARLIVTVRGFRGSTDTEPTGDVPPDAFKARLVATKLAVIQYTARAILNALRNPCSPALQHSHSHGGLVPGEVSSEARVAAVFGTWSLALAQVFTDARHLIRRLTVSGPAQLSYCTAEDKNIKLFASLHLGKQQKVSLACLWRQWHSGRSSLDEELAAALTQLSGLPSSEEIPADAVMYIAICAGAAPLLPGGLMDAVGMLRSAARWGSRLIGIGSESTSAADMAFRKVLDVHERDAQLLEEIMSFMTAPGAVLTPRQHAQFCDSCVRSCVPLVDLLRLAQTAAMEEKRMMLLRPFVFTNSSVMAIGN